jgi:hypothetical protein
MAFFYDFGTRLMESSDKSQGGRAAKDNSG